MKIKCEKHLFLLYIMLIDMLFLPYLKIIKTSFSSVIVIILILLNLKLFFSKSSYKYLILCVLPIFSILIALIEYPEYLNSNFSRLIIFELFVLIFFILLKSKKYLIRLRINEILFVYLCFNTCLAIIFFLDVNSYFLIRSFWSLGNSIESEYTLSILTRFTGIISDPNNCACVTVAVAAFIDRDYFSKMKTVCIYIMVSFIVLMTMSVTGLVCLLIFFIVRCNLFSGFNKIKLKYLFLLILMIVVSSVAFKFFLSTDYGELFLQRIEINTNSSDNSRIDIWMKIISKLNPIKFMCFGYGGNILVNNTMINPHSGHLYLIYNFGLIVYGIFMYIFLNLKYIMQNRLLYVIFFINFSLNTVLIDYRCSMVYVILLAFTALRHN